MTSPINQVIFSIDAESIGLYGEHFAVGYAVTDFKGNELEHGLLSCPQQSARGLDSNREWVLANVIPHLPTETTDENPNALKEKTYQVWMRINQQYEKVTAIADCMYPVETSLFSKMITNNESEREWTGPYPFHEVATALLIAGIDRNDYPRLPKELPEHHPVNDARYSSRLFLLTKNKLNA